MEVQTIQKYMHTSPRKLRLVADMVRKMNPNQALGVLRLTPKAAAKDLEKALQTVLANAKQQGLDAEKVNFKTIEVNESMKMRRFRAGTKGRVRPFKRRMSHIKIVLSDEIRKTQRVQRVRKSEDQQARISEDKNSETLKLRHSDAPSHSESSEKGKEKK